MGNHAGAAELAGEELQEFRSCRMDLRISRVGAQLPQVPPELLQLLNF
jgi:hypothetical protein